MDQDEHALVSALRAVAQHYRSSAQQQALGRNGARLLFMRRKLLDVNPPTELDR